MAVLMRQREGAGLGQHVLRGAGDAAVALGKLAADARAVAQALDLSTEGTLVGAHPLTHSTTRYHRILLCASNG